MKIVNNLTNKKTVKTVKSQQEKKEKSVKIVNRQINLFENDINYKELMLHFYPEIANNKDAIKLIEQNVVKKYKDTSAFLIIEFEEFTIKINKTTNQFLLETHEINNGTE